MTEWSGIRAYRCRHCGTNCLNEKGSELAETKQCSDCIAVPAIEDARRAADD